MSSIAPTSYIDRVRREWLIGGLVASCLVMLLSYASFWRPVGDMLYDALLRQTMFMPSDQVSIIAIDDATISKLGGWPLDRSVYAELLESLARPDYKPRVVGLNLLFIDPSGQDDRLGLAMQQHQTVLPVGITSGPDGRAIAEKPVPVLADSAHLSHINASFERDGSVRGIREKDTGYSHFSLRMLQLGLKETPFNLAPERSEIRRVHMMDPGAPYWTVSLSDVLEPLYPRDQFKDKYVLIGVTSPSLGDRFSTIYSGAYNSNTPGVAVLASTLQAALEGTFIHVAGSAPTMAFNLIGLWLILAGLLFLSPRRSLFWNLGFVFVWVLASHVALTIYCVWLDPTPLIFSVLLFLPIWTWRRMTTMARAIHHGAAGLSLSLPQTSSLKPTRRAEYVAQHAMLLDQAVEAVNGELAFLSLVIEELPDALAIFSSEKSLLLWNSSLEKLWIGKKLEPGMSVDLFAPWLGVEAYSLSKDQVRLVKFSSQEQSASALVQAMLKVSVIHSDRLGSVSVLVLTDISELRRLEAQRDKALQFLSHDMRTPVASILALVGDGKSNAQGIENHAQLLLQMMDDFCMLILADDPSYALQSALLQSLVDDALHRVNDLAMSKNITLDYVEESEPVFVRANARLFTRALVNLLHNAVKFSPVGGVLTVQITQTATHATVQMSNPIDHDQKHQRSKGFGLGLEFVDKVMANHKGTFKSHFMPNGQAVISITLPAERFSQSIE